MSCSLSGQFMTGFINVLWDPDDCVLSRVVAAASNFVPCWQKIKDQIYHPDKIGWIRILNWLFPPFPARTSTLQDLLTEAQSWRPCLDKTPTNFYTSPPRLSGDSLKWAVKFETVVDLGWATTLTEKTFLPRFPGHRSTEVIVGLGGVRLMGTAMHCQLPNFLRLWCTRPLSSCRRALSCSCLWYSRLGSADLWSPTTRAQKPAKPVTHNASDFYTSDILTVQPPGRSWGWSEPGLEVVLVLQRETSVLGMSTSISCTRSTGCCGRRT